MSGEAQILSPVQEAADLQRLLQAVIEGRAVGTPPADWPRTLALAQAHHGRGASAARSWGHTAYVPSAPNCWRR
jgi:hypothetical protein